MERRKLWQIPARHQLEIIDLALASNHERLAEQLREAVRVMDMSELLRSENTFSRSLQKKLDRLFANSINIFSEATNRWGLRLLWCGKECSSQPNQHIWAFTTHPYASAPLISHACSCAHCFGTKQV